MSPDTFANPASYAGSTKWQIKIFDGEPDYEPPQVNVVYKEHPRPKIWRVNLRTLEVMDLKPPRQELPKEFLEHIRMNLGRIRAAWDRKYPRNKVFTAKPDADQKAQEAKKGSRR